MRSRLFVLLAMLLASPAFGTARSVTADCIWTSVNAGCSWSGGGTPAVTDDFTIGTPYNVIAKGAIGLTTGSTTIATGGTLTIPAGTTYQYGDGTASAKAAGLILQTGGRLIQEGALLRTCRISSAPDWSAAVSGTHTVSANLDCDLTGVSTSTDYLFFADEDPADLDAVLTGRCVFYGAGLAPPGCYRPAYNKWASYKITAASAHAITWDLDPQAGNYTGTPYAGSRYAPSASAEPGNLITYTPRWLGRRTGVSIPNAYGAGVAITAADRGSWYLSYDEVLGKENDPAVCSGMQAKILSATDGGGGADLLEVQGDVSGCTSASAQARLTTGARRGDLVYVYRPASLTGNTSGGATTVGEGAIANTGGFWFARWARIDRPWASQTANWSPVTGRAGNVMFVQGNATDQPTADWNWVDLAYGAFTTGTDSGFVEIVSNAGSTDIRYPNNGIIDASGLKFRHLHIHDWMNNAAAGGGHGIYIDTAKNVDLSQVRVERINDDCIGAQFVDGSGSASANSDIKIRHALVYECIASTDNSQEGIQFQIENHGAGAANVAFLNPVTIQDALSIGVHRSPFEMVTGGGTYKGITTGGENFVGNVAVFKARWDGTGDQSTLDEATVGAGSAYGNHVYDSNIYSLGASTSTTPTQICGDVHGSFIAGLDSTAVTTAGHGYTGVFDASIVDLGPSSTGGYIVNGAGATLPLQFRKTSMSNSVFRTTVLAASRFSNAFAGLTASGLTNQITRVAFLTGAAEVPGGGNGGILLNYATGTNITNSTTTIDGFYVTSADTTIGSGILQTGTGNVVTVNTACIEGNNLGAVFGASSMSASRNLVDPLAPASTDMVMLRDLVTSGDAYGCRGQNLPTKLGYEQFRIGHAMLGDFEIRDYQRSSSSDLIVPNAAPSYRSGPRGSL